MTAEEQLRPRRTPLVFRVTAVLLGIIAALVVGELAARFTGLGSAPEWNRQASTPTAARGVVVRRWPQATAASFRVLVVGDSFTRGPGVDPDATFPAVLANRLVRQIEGVEVMAVSRSGWSSRDESRYLAANWEALRPQLLIVAHCLNDSETVPVSRALEDRPELLPWRPKGRLEVGLARRSALYLRVRRALDTIRLRPLLRNYYRGLYEDRRGRRLWRRALLSLRRLAEDDSIPSVLVIFPIFDFDDSADYAYRDIHRLVGSTARKAGFEVLDLLPAFEGKGGRELALVPFTDPHPSAAAHAIAGHAIADFVAAEGLGAPPKEGV